MSKAGHWKVVYPAGTPRGEMRTMRKSTVYLVTDGQEIKLPAITGFAFDTSIDEPDRITLKALGSVEVAYAEETEELGAGFDETDFLVADLKAAREEP